MFPNPDDFPTLFSQRLRYQTVSRHVTRNLPFPIRSMRLRYPALRGVAMPETTVNKNHHPRLWEYEVRFPDKRIPASPPRDAAFAQGGNEAGFGRAIAVRLHLRHNPRALLSAECIHLTCCPNVTPHQALAGASARLSAIWWRGWFGVPLHSKKYPMNIMPRWNSTKTVPATSERTSATRPPFRGKA